VTAAVVALVAARGDRGAPLPWARAFGRGVGLGLARSERRVARVTRRNVALTFPIPLALPFPHLEDDQRKHFARAGLAHTAALVA